MADRESKGAEAKKEEKPESEGRAIVDKAKTAVSIAGNATGLGWPSRIARGVINGVAKIADKAEGDGFAAKVVRRASKLPILGSALKKAQQIRDGVGEWSEGALETMGEMVESAKKGLVDDVASGRAANEQHFKNMFADIKRVFESILFALKDAVLKEQTDKGKLLTDKGKEAREAKAAKASSATKSSPAKENKVMVKGRDELDKLAKGQPASMGITTAVKSAEKAANKIKDNVIK